MVRTQIQLTEFQWETLRRVSDEQGVSVAELIRRSVDSTLRGNFAGRGAEERLAQVSALMGKYKSGTGDIAENHDRYLDEAYHA